MSVTQRYKISYETVEAARAGLHDRIVHIEKTLAAGGLDTLMADYWRDQLKKARKAYAELGSL